MSEYKQYVPDGDYFYLVHEMVTKLDMFKGFDCSYNSKSAHEGVFTVKHDDTVYSVTVAKKDCEHNRNKSSKVKVNVCSKEPIDISASGFYKIANVNTADAYVLSKNGNDISVKKAHMNNEDVDSLIKLLGIN